MYWQKAWTLALARGAATLWRPWNYSWNNSSSEILRR